MLQISRCFFTVFSTLCSISWPCSLGPAGKSQFTAALWDWLHWKCLAGILVGANAVKGTQKLPAPALLEAQLQPRWCRSPRSSGTAQIPRTRALAVRIAQIKWEVCFVSHSLVSEIDHQLDLRNQFCNCHGSEVRCVSSHSWDKTHALTAFHAL